MATFDFVTDDDLRSALEADAAEMAACFQANAFKAVHVLAGSIVEALLVDHLKSIDYKDPKGIDLLELDLGQLVSAARTQKVISSTAADLASAVKGYRNLIHPGRLVRLKETVNRDKAAIAAPLVEVIAADIAQLKKKTYGYTAQQLLTKVEQDPTSLSILGDLLKRTKDREVQDLLSAIPGHYIDIQGWAETQDAFDRLSRLKTAYRVGFDGAPDAVKRRVAAEYSRILREGSGPEVEVWEEDFFRATDLEFMTEDDMAIAKRHLLSRLDRDPKADLTQALVGIGKFADERELSSLTDMYLRPVLGSDVPDRRAVAAEKLLRLWHDTPAEREGAIVSRLATWQNWLAQKGRSDLAAWVGQQSDEMVVLDDLPF
jgi:hypothetical protein